MKRSILTLFLLFLFVVFAQAQSTPIKVHVDHGSLKWTWTISGNVSADGFDVKCTHVGAPGNPVTTNHITNSATRSIILTDIPLTVGSWSCVVDAYHGSTTSSNSNTVSFTVENILPAPFNVTVK